MRSISLVLLLRCLSVSDAAVEATHNQLEEGVAKATWTMSSPASSRQSSEQTRMNDGPASPTCNSTDRDGTSEKPKLEAPTEGYESNVERYLRQHKRNKVDEAVTTIDDESCKLTGLTRIHRLRAPFFLTNITYHRFYLAGTFQHQRPFGRRCFYHPKLTGGRCPLSTRQSG